MQKRIKNNHFIEINVLMISENHNLTLPHSIE